MTFSQLHTMPVAAQLLSSGAGPGIQATWSYRYHPGEVLVGVPQALEAKGSLSFKVTQKWHDRTGFGAIGSPHFSIQHVHTKVLEVPPSWPSVKRGRPI